MLTPDTFFRRRLGRIRLDQRIPRRRPAIILCCSYWLRHLQRCVHYVLLLNVAQRTSSLIRPSCPCATQTTSRTEAETSARPTGASTTSDSTRSDSQVESRRSSSSSLDLSFIIYLFRTRSLSHVALPQLYCPLLPRLLLLPRLALVLSPWIRCRIRCLILLKRIELEDRTRGRVRTSHFVPRLPAPRSGFGGTRLQNVRWTKRRGSRKRSLALWCFGRKKIVTTALASP